MLLRGTNCPTLLSRSLVSSPVSTATKSQYENSKWQKERRRKCRTSLLNEDNIVWNIWWLWAKGCNEPDKTPALQQRSEQTKCCLHSLCLLSVKWIFRVQGPCKDPSSQYEGEFKSPGWRTNNQCAPCHLPYLHTYEQCTPVVHSDGKCIHFHSLFSRGSAGKIHECRIKKKWYIKNDLIAKWVFSTPIILVFNLVYFPSIYWIYSMLSRWRLG